MPHSESRHPIVVVLHGGLGNQLFQYFFATLLSAAPPQARIQLVTGLLSRYQSARDFELRPLVDHLGPRVGSRARAGPLLRLRIPKLLGRLTSSEVVVRLPWYGTLVDGYFQESRQYERFDADVVATTLADWRRTLAAEGRLAPKQRERLTHIRLADFMRTSAEAASFAADRLAAIGSPSDVVTDQEDLVGAQLRQPRLRTCCTLVPTGSMSAWELLLLFSRYRRISTNGSTLAFWAAILSDAQLETTNMEHMKIWGMLCRKGVSSRLPPS